MNTHYINLAILSSYVDVNDYDNPLHHFIQDKNKYYLVSLMSQRILFQVRQNQAFLNDNLIIGSQGSATELEFYSIEQAQTIISSINSDNGYMQISFTLDQQIDQFQRIVYSFLDMLGFIGGVFGVLYKFGMIVVNFISKRSFYSSVLSTLYNHENEKLIKESEQIEQNNINLKESVNGKLPTADSFKFNKVIPTQDENKEPNQHFYNNIREELKSDLSKGSIN